MLKIGEVVVAFTLTAEDDKTISPSGFRVKEIVLYFYPKANTPGCTKNGGKQQRGV